MILLSLPMWDASCLLLFILSIFGNSLCDLALSFYFIICLGLSHVLSASCI